MKTSNLIKELESLKYVNRVITEKGMILVHGTYRLIATVREHKSFEMAMVLTDLDINDEQRKELFELISEYAATPVEDRREKTIQEKVSKYIQEYIAESLSFESARDLLECCNLYTIDKREFQGIDMYSEEQLAEYAKIYEWYHNNSNEFIEIWMEASRND